MRTAIVYTDRERHREALPYLEKAHRMKGIKSPGLEGEIASRLAQVRIDLIVAWDLGSNIS